MKRFIALVLFCCFSALSLAAEPILIPDITPGTTAEFGLANQFQVLIHQGLKDKGYMILTSQTARPVVGAQIDGCFEEQTCPFGPLQHLPARLALVARVVRDVDRVLLQVATYDGTSIQPVDTHELVVTGADDPGLVSVIIAMVEDAAADLEPAPESMWEAAAELVTKSAMRKGTPSATTVPVPVVDTTPNVIVNINQAGPATTVQSGPVPAVGAPTVPVSTVRQRGPVSYPPRFFFGAKKDFKKSGLEPRGWMLRRTPHAGRFIVELAGGIGIGDVDRYANVHVRITDEASYGWYQEGPAAAARVRGSFYLGYAPTASFDFGIAGGLQYGFKVLVSGWSDETSSSQDTSTKWGTAEAQAIQMYIQPRARFYMVWVGPAKPYAVVGFETRMFDSLKIAEQETVKYPNPSGGVFFGPVFGLGLMLDPSPTIGLFVEGAYTAHFGMRADFAQNDVNIRPEEVVAPNAFRKHTVGIVGGVQFRL